MAINGVGVAFLFGMFVFRDQITILAGVAAVWPVLLMVFWAFRHGDVTLFMDGHNKPDITIGFLAGTFALLAGMGITQNVVSYNPAIIPALVLALPLAFIWLMCRKAASSTIIKNRMLPFLGVLIFITLHAFGTVLYLNDAVKSGQHQFTDRIEIAEIRTTSLVRGGKTVHGITASHERLQNPVKIRLNDYVGDHPQKTESVELEITTGALGIQTWRLISVN